MLGNDIQENCDMRTAFGLGELVAREFMNKKSAVRHRVDQRQRRSADIAGQFYGDSSVFRDVMNERCRRAFALCAGDTDDFVLRIIA